MSSHPGLPGRARPFRRLAATIGGAALLVAGCGGDSAEPGGSGLTPAAPPNLELKRTEQDVPVAGFDECGLAEPEEVAEALGVDAMYVSSRAVVTQSDGVRRAVCTYFPEDVPGMLGMQLSTVVDTDPERFFAPFANNFKNVKKIDKLGDRAEAVAYKANGTSKHYVEVRTIVGDRGLHLYYTYQDGGVMPKADGAAAAVILTSALERLPAEVTIADGRPEGRCADIDLDHAAEALGAELVVARSVVSEGDAMSCYFAGGGASFDVSVLTDPSRAKQAAVTPDKISHADVGDGARLLVTETGSLDARVNVGDRVVVITAAYGDAVGKVTEPRPADVELVRTIVDATT